MVNLNTNIIVCSKNPDERLVPASITKIMTALVCFEKVSDFSQIVECPYVCFDEFWGTNKNFWGASTADIQTKQDNLTYTDCLYALMLRSGCEAANIIAYNVAGDIPTFVDMMNETAAKIGCTNTHFTNAHGLYEKDNYTSARDMYLITRYAMDTYPGFMKICETVSYEMPANRTNPNGYTVYHTNQMMRTNTDYYYEGVKGIKTGSINEYFEQNSEGKWEKVETRGTRTLVSVCEKDGYSYLLVTLAPFYAEDGTSPNYPYIDQKALYDWAFSEFEYAKVIGKNEFVMTVPVDLALDMDEVGIVTNGEYYTLLPKMEGAESIIQKIRPEVEPMSAENGIEKGVYVGDMKVVMGNEVVATIPLVTERYVAVDQNELYRRRIGTVLSSAPFKISVGAVILLIIAVIVIRIIVKTKKKEQPARRRIAVQSSQQKGGKPPRDKRK
ncbi:MAG: D-alanyl-D-alanine carboxypeptidase [Oscillospiraceae bacterium]|nr:D-alanyl-D-alanine carboxypeptidase [Oscillospiraceae bacterium]